MKLRSLLGTLFVFAVLFLLGVYYLAPYSNLELSVRPRNYNFNINNESGMQFYNNMRFLTTEITYLIDTKCSITKRQEMKDAFKIIENITPLVFYPTAVSQDISIACDEKHRFEGGMFIAGEGGPSKIVKSGEYNVILEGTILLIRDSRCERPNIAIHELLHVLGFKHSNNPNNIMYNFTKCSQTIGDDTIDLIKEVYSEESLPNLAFEDVSATINKRYLNLNASIRNSGLANAASSVLSIKINNKTIKDLDITNMEIGHGITVSISNLFIKSLSFDEIELVIESNFEELDKEDNTLFLDIED